MVAMMRAEIKHVLPEIAVSCSPSAVRTGWATATNRSRTGRNARWAACARTRPVSSNSTNATALARPKRSARPNSARSKKRNCSSLRLPRQCDYAPASSPAGSVTKYIPQIYSANHLGRSTSMEDKFDMAAGRLRALQAAMRGCMRCAALVRCRSQVVPGHGAAPATLAFVGLALDAWRRPHRNSVSGDRSGNLLRLMIARADLERVFITNVVRCNPRICAGAIAIPPERDRQLPRPSGGRARPGPSARSFVCLGAVAWREMAGRGAPLSAAPCSRTQ